MALIESRYYNIVCATFWKIKFRGSAAGVGTTYARIIFEIHINYR